MNNIFRIVAAMAVCLAAVSCNDKELRTIYFCGPQDNLLAQQLEATHRPVVYVSDPMDAVTKAAEGAERALAAAEKKHPDAQRPATGGVVVVAAPGYPAQRAPMSAEVYALAREKGVKLFVEYPSQLPEGPAPETFTANIERAVAVPDVFGLKPMSILGINGCRLVKVPVQTAPAEAGAAPAPAANSPLIIMGKVAGYDTAIFGVDDLEESYPVLYFADDNTLIATTSISNCVNGRYGPVDSWEAVTGYIRRWICGNPIIANPELAEDPHPAYGRGERVPRSAYRQSAVKAADWLWNAGLLVRPEWKDGAYGGRLPKEDREMRTRMHGDGSLGVMEGHFSTIQEDGWQDYRYFMRADVQGESAYLLATAGAITGEKQYNETAANLLDWLFYESEYCADQRRDPSHPAYGMIGWGYGGTHQEEFYGDDNARAVMGAIGASALLGENRWNKEIVANILTTFRMSNSHGFTYPRNVQGDMERLGWQWWADLEQFRYPSPHFMAYMWSLYLWLYDRTGYAPLLEKTRAGIEHMMQVYPEWITQNGMQQERARMILPLAWLVRVDDTPEHRDWLDTMVGYLLDAQDECGAIREELGRKGGDVNNMLIGSNAEYGKGEASLIARNGDPVADMLYTCNFAFLALNEAAAATGNSKYAKATEKLADFLVRIQAESERYPEFDGAWFRAFDYSRWEYWGSNADKGWGAWCTLTGWIETWIGTTEALVADGTSFWDLISRTDVSEAFEQNLWMLER
ncbi:MAG: hypothetical protein KBS55_03765 [Bacteroidales bacterium]|nr:hypothetical protein [Candidatus Cryptobacteroides aphodequi]